MHPANEGAGLGIEHVDEVGGAAFEGGNIKQAPIGTEREPVDIGIDRLVPHDLIRVDVEAVEHPHAGTVAVGDVEFAGGCARRDALHVVHVRHSTNHFDARVYESL